MITPIHTIFNLAIYLGVSSLDFININYYDLIFLLSAELIDLDHLATKPIFAPHRNSFRTHPLHKAWPLILPIAILMIFYRPVLFLGIGLISHYLLDFIDTKYKFTNKNNI